MKFKRRLLVFPCGSEIGLEIHNALKYSKHVELFGASSIDDHGKFVYTNYIRDIPFVYDKNFINTLNKIIKKHKIDLVYPAHDDVVYKLALNRNKLVCSFIGPDKYTAEICRFKSKTYTHFQNILATPIVYKDVTLIKKFPVFLKPDSGQGTRGTFIAYNKNEVEFYTNRDSSLLVLEYLPGEEYTVDCFTDRHGELLFVGPRVRARIQNGISVSTFPVKNKRSFIRYAKLINKNLNLRGAWFFQVKRNSSGKLTLMEIANRIAGSMALYRNLGVNFELLSIYDFNNVDVKVILNKFKIVFDRALSNKFKVDIDYNCVYVDLDDCLLLNNKVNTKLISFLYQCVNNKKKIYLITKHQSKIEQTLDKYKIRQLFDKIYHLDFTQKKSSIISDKKAIFIDDSFSEREEVKKNCNIPVFSPDTVECLLDSYEYC